MVFTGIGLWLLSSVLLVGAGLAQGAFAHWCLAFAGVMQAMGMVLCLRGSHERYMAEKATGVQAE